jgi:drug/metabolite transporter (DMT)-like permease
MEFMTWFMFAFLTALSVAVHDTCVKKWFSHLSAYEMFVFPLLYSLPLCAISLLFISVPCLDRIFYITFLISLPFNAIPFFMYITAIKISPLSLTVPYLAFTPVFMIGTGYLMLNEVPDIWGIAGIGAVCVGSYVLNIDLKNRSFSGPLRAVFKETGSWMMLIVSFVFSISAVLGKVAILHSSVLFFQMSFFAVLNLMIIVVFLLFGKIRLKTFVAYPVKGMVAGVLFYCHIIFHGYGIAMTKAAYMMSIKRLSIVFGVIFGGLVFHEENFLMRFLGAMLMFAGAVVILLMAG